MRGAQHGGVRQFLLQQRKQSLGGSIVQRGGGFVHRQNLRAVQQGAGDADALLLAVRQARLPIGYRVQFVIQPRQADFCQRGADGIFGQGRCTGVAQQVFQAA